MNAVDAIEFWAIFNDQLGQYRVDLERVDASNHSGIISDLKRKIADLQVLATEAVHYLVPYDIKRSQEVITA